MKKKIRWFVKKIPRAFRSMYGWGDGYIVVPKDHPACKKNWADLAEEYELTFIERASILNWSEITDEERNTGAWVFGIRDIPNYNRWTKRMIKRETKLLAKQFEDFYDYEKNSTK